MLFYRMKSKRRVSFHQDVIFHTRDPDRDPDRDQTAPDAQAAPEFGSPETRLMAEQVPLEKVIDAEEQNDNSRAKDLKDLVQSQDQLTPRDHITSESDRNTKIIAAERSYEKLRCAMDGHIEARRSFFEFLCSKLSRDATEADRINCAAEARAEYAEEGAKLYEKILAAYSVLYHASKVDRILPERKIIPPVSNALPEIEVSRLSQAVQECKEKIRTLKKKHHDFTVAFNTSYDEVMATYNHKKTGRRTRNKLSRDMESRRDAYRKVQEQFDMTHRQLSFDLGELTTKWAHAWSN